MGRRTFGLVVLALGGAACGLAQGISFSNPQLESVFGLPRPDHEDVVYFCNKDILRGQVLNEKLTVAAPYGTLSIPFRACAGLSFEGTRTNTEEVVLVNFNRITGIIVDPVLRFRVGPSGAEIPIRKEKIRFVLLGTRAEETDFLEDQARSDLFVMTNGDVLSGEAVEPKITVRTDYGQVPVLFAEMKELRRQGDASPATVVTKTNGDTVRGVLETEEMSLRLAIGMDLPAVHKNSFVRILVGQAKTQAPVEFDRPPFGEDEADALAPGEPLSRGQPTMTLYLGRQVTLKLALIPAGKFVMGSPSGEAGRHDEEGPLRTVVMSRPFYLGIHEVTQSQYAVILGRNPSRFKGATRPVETVSWEDAVEFCTRLSERTGKKITLPTEAQWEYACRAGSRTRFCFGDDESQLRAYARYGQSGQAGTVPVGLGRPNAWGLYDMHGNVTEWCFDRYAGSYSDLSSVDPTGPHAGPLRVVRGGCWGNAPEDCRTAARKGFAPDSRTVYRGFRVVVLSN